MAKNTNTTRPKPTDDERIEHLKKHLKAFLQNVESRWGCPSKNDGGTPCGRLMKKQPDIRSIAHLLLSVVEPEGCAEWDGDKFPDFDSKLLNINCFIDSVACYYHKKHLQDAVSNFQKKNASSSTKSNPTSGIASSKESVSITFKNETKDEFPSPPATEQSKLTNQTYGMETPPRPTHRRLEAKYAVGSNTPARPAPAPIQTTPGSTCTPLSDTKSFHSYLSVTSSTHSVFTPGDSGELTPFTPPSTTPSSEAKIAVLESQDSPSFARSSRRIISQSTSTTKPKFDLSKLQNKEGLKSSLNEESEDSLKHNDAQRTLFDSVYKNGGVLKKTAVGELDHIFGISDPKSTSPPQGNKSGDCRNPTKWSPAQNDQVNIDGPLSESVGDTKLEGDSRNTAITTSDLTSRSLDEAKEEVVLDENAQNELNAAPKIPKYPLVLEKYSKKTAMAHIYNTIEKPPGAKAKKEGLVYIAIHKHWVSDDNNQLIKIGFTTKSARERYDTDECKEIAKNALFVAHHSKKFIGADRVEQLVLADFDKVRYWMHCPTCGKRHREWVISTQDKVLNALRFWTRFVKMSPDPDKRTLSTEARNILSEILSKEKLEVRLEMLKTMQGPHNVFVFENPMPLHRMTNPNKFVPISAPVRFVANSDLKGHVDEAKVLSKVEQVAETSSSEIHDNSTSQEMLEPTQIDVNNEDIVVEINKSSRGWNLTLAGIKESGLRVMGKAIEVALGAAMPMMVSTESKEESGSKAGLVRSKTWQSLRSG